MKEVSRMKAKAKLAEYIEDWVSGQQLGVSRFSQEDPESISEYEKLCIEESQCAVDVGVEVIKYLCGGK